MPPTADGSSTVAKIAADLRLSADGSAVRTSLVDGVPIVYSGTDSRTDRQKHGSRYSKVPPGAGQGHNNRAVIG